MNPYSLFTLLPLLLSLFTIAYMVGLRINTPVSRAILIYLCAIFVMYLGDFFRFITVTPQWTALWMQVVGVSFCLLGLLTYNYSMLLAGQRRNAVWWFFAVAALMCVILTFIMPYQEMIYTEQGVPHHIQALPVVGIMFILCSFLPQAASIIISFFPAKTLSKQERKILRLMRTVMIYSLGIAPVFLIVIPVLLKRPDLYYLNPLCILIILTGIIIVMKRYFAKEVELKDLHLLAGTLFDHIQTGVIIFDREKKIVYGNHSVYGMFRLQSESDDLLHRLSSLFPNMQQYTSVAEQQTETIIDGAERHFRYSIIQSDRSDSLLGSIVLIQDITEQVLRDRDVERNRHLESIGQLAAGIAHDFNNYLASITLAVSLAKNDKEKCSGHLAMAEGASSKAAKLVEQLLTFTKGGAPVKETVSAAELITETADFMIHGKNITLQTSFETAALSFKADRT